MPADIQIYCDMMANIRNRINVVQTILSGGIHVGLPGQLALQDSTAELVFVQFRKVLESIAFASLSANKEKYAEVHAQFSKHWRAKDMLAVMDTVNPDFLPIPMPEPVETTPGHYFFGDPLVDDIFTREDFIFLYKCSSEALHTHNPYRTGDSTINIKYTAQEWATRLQMLLKCHRTHLVSGQVWVVSIPCEGSVRVFSATPSS